MSENTNLYHENGLLIVTPENYFSLEASRQYMSVSQFKSFREELGGCEAKAVAILKGEYEEEEKDAFVEGHYIHAWNEGTLDEFKANNPDLYSSRGATAGQLKTEFQRCNKMISVLESDPFVMKVLEGQKEVVFTAELFGTPWKIMIDSYAPHKRAFADLKGMKNLGDKFWNTYARRFENFVQHYAYDLQFAIYAEVERLANGRPFEDWYMPHAVVVDKQPEPDHEIIYYDNDIISKKLFEVECFLPEVLAVKRGEREPKRCEKCAYCRSTKKLKAARHYSEFEV